MQNIAVTFHCKPYVAQWLTDQYGSPVRLPHKTNFRKQFLATLCKQFYPRGDYNKATFTAQVDVWLNKDDIQQHGFSVSLALQNEIHSVIEEQLKNQLFIFIHAQVIGGYSVNHAVRSYQQVMGFSEETFSFDAIRQSYFRRKKEYTKIFRKFVTVKIKKHHAPNQPSLFAV